MKIQSENSKWIELPYSGTSLFYIIKTGTFQSTSLGNTKWLSLITGAKLQNYCKREGFNVKAGGIRTQIGIAMNDQVGGKCSGWHDSFLGFGNEGTFSGISITAFSGNEFKTWSSNHSIIKTYGYILVR